MKSARILEPNKPLEVQELETSMSRVHRYSSKLNHQVFAIVVGFKKSILEDFLNNKALL